MFDPNATKVLAYELENRSLGLVIVETCILIVFAVAALVGNSCVLFVFYKSPDLRTVANYYLITLAVSDFAFPVITMPPLIATAATGRDMYGDQGKVIGFIGLSFALGSILTTSLIAKNRFFCIVKPQLYKKFFKKKPAICMIAGAWAIAILGNVLLSLNGKIMFVFDPGRMIYFPSSQDIYIARFFTALNQFLFVVLPLSLTVICYWKVYRSVKVHNATMATNINTGPTNRNSFSKNEIQVTKSLLALVCGSLFCWIPSASIDQISLYVSLPRSVQMITIYAASSSSAINPVIFYIFNRPFRRRFYQLFGHFLPISTVPSTSNESQTQGSNHTALTKVRRIQVKNAVPSTTKSGLFSPSLNCNIGH
ncbi:neuropeptide FF receptor 2-like [Actinia tenebrosa]|uniref:Neuropeptide FF receptor 2-like n=1 Tax=Actinia tenebrosa TaxID=6105 RepID=A0A6P8HJH5_ACTTE|nr:neuropeptide FF receptor 2-like [Actinia tenebrosa]